MAESRTAIDRSGFGATTRPDTWWLELIPVIVVLGAFSVYLTWRTFENAHYEWGPVPFAFLLAANQAALVATLASDLDSVGEPISFCVRLLK